MHLDKATGHVIMTNLDEGDKAV